MLKVKKLNPQAKLPVRSSEGAGGWDLCALESQFIPEGSYFKIPTGLAMALPHRTVGLLRSRSSSFRTGLVIDGTIDEDYRGELFICGWAMRSVEVEAGQRVAQLILTDYQRGTIGVEVIDLPETLRGDGGFGSTGR